MIKEYTVAVSKPTNTAAAAAVMSQGKGGHLNHGRDLSSSFSLEPFDPTHPSLLFPASSNHHCVRFRLSHPSFLTK